MNAKFLIITHKKRFSNRAALANMGIIRRILDGLGARIRKFSANF